MNCSMARRVLTLLWGAGAGLYPVFSFALGLGDLQVQSRLNQPLRARIEVSDVSDEEWQHYVRGRVSSQAAQADGAVKLGLLESLTFRNIEDTEHRRFIEIRSSEVFTEPLFDLTIDVLGQEMQVTRNYTVFLDPPGPDDDLPGARGPQLARQPLPAVRQGSESTAPAGHVAQHAAVAQAGQGAAPQHAAVGGHHKHASGAGVSSQPAAADVAGTTAAAGGVYTVAKSDTLERIARRFGGTNSASRNRFMDWVFQHNSNAFYGDMNRLRAGVRLTLPADATGVAGTVSAASGAGGGVTPPAAPAAPGVAQSAGGEAVQQQLEGEVTGMQQELAGLQKMLAQQDAQIASLKQQLAARAQESDGEPSQADVVAHPSSSTTIETPAARRAAAAAARAAEQTARDGESHSWLSGLWARYSLKTEAYFWLAGSLVLLGLLAWLVQFIRRRIEDTNPTVHLRYPIGPSYQPIEDKPAAPGLNETMPVISSSDARARLLAARKARRSAESAPEATDHDHHEEPAGPQSGLDTWRTQTALLEQDILSETDVLPFVLDTHNQLKAMDEELIAPEELTADTPRIAGTTRTERMPRMPSAGATEKLPQMSSVASPTEKLPQVNETAGNTDKLPRVELDELDAQTLEEQLAASYALDFEESGMHQSLDEKSDPDEETQDEPLEGELIEQMSEAHESAQDELAPPQESTTARIRASLPNKKSKIG